MAGALDFYGDPANQGLIGLATGLLQAGGPSPMPRSFGQALGSGFQGMQQAQHAALVDQQSQALLKLEQQKTALTQEQVRAAQRQQALQEWALTGHMPPNLFGQGAQDQQQPPAVQQGSMSGSPVSFPSPVPSGAPGGASGLPALPSGSPLSGLPQSAQDAIRLNIGLPGSGNIAWQSQQPIVGREGGIYRRTPNGGMELDPAWLQGEQKRLELQKAIENQNTVVDFPLANGQSQKMTRAQQLSLVGATNQLSSALPNLDKSVVADIQRQMLSDPDKPVDVNINLGGRQAKLTLQPLRGELPGVPSGQSTEARSAQEKSGTNAGDVQSQIDTEASGALQSRKILGEMRSLSQDFNQGKVAPMQRALGEWAQALKLPGNWADEIKSAESQQALQKLTAQMATAAMKQFTNRGTQMEFKTFLQNNPNAELTPGGFQKVLEFMDRTAGASLEKQQAYLEWRKANPVERSQDFLAEWNRKQSAELAPEAPKGQTFQEKPPAKDYRGKRIKDTQTGKFFESDGMIWKEVK